MPPEGRQDIGQLWAAFIEEGTQAGYIELVDVDGQRIAVDYSATANVEPGMHLSVLMEREDDAADVAGPEPDRTTAGAEAEHSRVLTPRERQVLGHLAMGATGTEVAGELFLSAETVRTHVRNARDKLGARTRAHAIVLALREGELELPLGKTS